MGWGAGACRVVWGFQPSDGLLISELDVDALRTLRIALQCLGGRDVG